MEIRQAIDLYLRAKAFNDAEFKERLDSPNKDLDECVLYIQAKMLDKVTEEQKKGGAAVVIPSDDEIFALAEQYYLDDDLKVDGSKFNNVRILSASAKINGKRVETIEVDLHSFQLIQSRGLQNKYTKYHNRIVKLVEDNMGEIRERFIKAA